METMDSDWQLFIAIAEEGSMTKAASRLYVSQPALSYRLQQLEKQCKKPLVIRTSKGITLTETGEAYYQFAKDMLKRQRDFEESLINTDDHISGILRLGVSNIYAHYELPALLQGFTNQYPHIKLEIYTGVSWQVARMFTSNEVQVAIVRGPQCINGESFLIHHDQICMVTHTDLPKAPLPRKDLLQLPFIRYATAHDLYYVIDSWWKQHYDVPPNDSIKVDTMDTCRQFIRKNLGWSILPETGLDRFSDEFHVEPLYWKDGTPITRETNLCYHEDSLGRKPIEAFVNYIKDSIANK